MTRILTIIVTFNAMQWVDRCIGSVQASQMYSDVFVIDNGSTDGTADYIAKHYPGAILYRSPQNLKFGKGNNLGLEYAIRHDYDYVYLLNQDAWVMPDTFSKMVAVFENHPEYGILSPMQMAPNNVEFEMLFNRLVVKKLPEDYPSVQVCDVDFVQAANWMISRRCLETVGGFSPSFPHYGEDENYCDRTLFNGFRIGVVSQAFAVHDAANKPLVTRAQKRYRHYINFVIKMSSLRSTETTFQRLVFLLKRAKGLAVEQHDTSSFSAYFKLLVNLPSILKNKKLSATGKTAFIAIKSATK